MLGKSVLHPQRPPMFSVVFVCALCVGCYGGIYIILCSITQLDLELPYIVNDSSTVLGL